MALGLNIVATRKLSLKGFAEGWDDCYLLIRSASDKEQKQWAVEAQPYKEEKDDERKAAILEDLTERRVMEVIIGGRVITTDEDGTSRPVEFGKEDVSVVVEALSFYWRNEAVNLASGVDRLKAMI
ncbi:hypothetical protein [Rhodococcus aetherivorans]|uniref:hypothetical protein n=1 Tax=Rhodococcus aetherivorans TaxID=191292 RepID=UPI00294981B3|nr:hypothetical protein [Rhodococcus aetherivorans]MDV6295182.1 hypothetical protein [Rhodococcus aetherivorans]